LIPPFEKLPRCRVSQLELAGEAGISTKHLSLIEPGR
jgi:hypothetical protein